MVGTPPRVRGELGAACLAVSGVYFTFFDFNDTAHPELWQGFFMLAPAWLIVRAPNGVLSARRAFAAGLLACVAVIFERVAAITGVLSGVAIVLLALRRLDSRRAPGMRAPTRSVSPSSFSSQSRPSSSPGPSTRSGS